MREETDRLLDSESDFFLREAYKTMRMNVNFSLADQAQCKVIIATSAQESEGKSITAANLAISFAETDARVLLVDCDLRQPRMGRMLKINAPVGLSDVLVKPELLDEAMISYKGKLDILLAGSIPPNPSELLGSVRMQEFIRNAREKYDYIVLDTPPVNVVSDSLTLAPQSDGVLLVVRMNQSDRISVRAAIEQMEYAQVKILGVVLNGVKLAAGHHGDRHYGRYGRKYGYGKYGYGAAPAAAEQTAEQKPAEKQEAAKKGAKKH